MSARSYPKVRINEPAYVPLKVALLVDGLDPSTARFLGPHDSAPKQHHDRFNPFCTAYITHRLTDHATCDICSNRSHLHITCGRCDLTLNLNLQIRRWELLDLVERTKTDGYLVSRYAIVDWKLEHVGNVISNSVVSDGKQQFPLNCFSIVSHTIDHLETDVVKHVLVHVKLEQQASFPGVRWRSYDLGRPFCHWCRNIGNFAIGFV